MKRWLAPCALYHHFVLSTRSKAGGWSARSSWWKSTWRQTLGSLNPNMTFKICKKVNFDGMRNNTYQIQQTEQHFFFWWQTSVDAHPVSSCLCRHRYNFPALIFPEDKVNKSSETPRRTKGTNTKFPNHTEYIYSTTSKKMPAEFGGEKRRRLERLLKAYCCSHRREGYNGTTTRERGGERKTENERTASLVLPNNGQILQNILLTIFTKIPGSGQICVGNSQRTPCAFNCDGSELKIDFLVSTSGNRDIWGPSGWKSRKVGMNGNVEKFRELEKNESLDSSRTGTCRVKAL